jgi:hypothetical protein
MQIHPLFSVKKAAEALGVEKQFLRNQLEQGMIRGEKRRVGERDKWFIYNGEVKDLRDTKRLHELLERAGRISTEDMGDFFDEDEDTVSARETTSKGAPGTTAETIEHLESAATIETIAPSESAVPAANDVVDVAMVDVAAVAAAPAVTAESLLELLTELLDDQQVNQLHDTSAIVENQLATTSESQSSTSSSSSYTDDIHNEKLEFGDLFFESRIIDDLSVDDLFFEKVEVVEAGDVDFPEEDELVNIDDTVSGSAKITVESMLQKLTAEFAFQLAEERNRVTELTHQLELKEESLKLLPDLERRLEAEQSVRQAHQEEVTILKAQITSLEAERINANKPWWKKLFA